MQPVSKFRDIYKQLTYCRPGSLPKKGNIFPKERHLPTYTAKEGVFV